MKVKQAQRVTIIDDRRHTLPEVLKGLTPIEGFVHGPAPTTPGRLEGKLWRVGVKDVAEVVVHEEQMVEPQSTDFYVSYVQEDATAGTMKVVQKTPGAAMLEAIGKISDMVEEGEPVTIVATRAKPGEHVTEVVLPARPRMKVEGS